MIHARTCLVLEANRNTSQSRHQSHTYGLCWQYNYVADVVSPSTGLAFVTKISEKHKPTSPSTIQEKNPQKTIGIKEKLDVISQLEKGE